MLSYFGQSKIKTLLLDNTLLNAYIKDIDKPPQYKKVETMTAQTATETRRATREAFSCRLDPLIYNRLRTTAARLDITQAALIERALTAYFGMESTGSIDFLERLEKQIKADMKALEAKCQS